MGKKWQNGSQPPGLVPGIHPLFNFVSGLISGPGLALGLLLSLLLGVAGCFSATPAGYQSAIPADSTIAPYTGFLLELKRDGKHLLDKSPVIVIEDDRYSFELLFPGVETFLSDEADKLPTVWYRLTPESLREEHPWDLTHRLLKQLAENKYELFQYVVHIEPDMNNTLFLPQKEKSVSLDCTTAKPNTYWPAPNRFGWHLEAAYSQLAAAREVLGVPDGLERIRIAHLDTGYDPDHITFPAQRVLFELQHNFVAGEDPADARDPGISGLFFQPGHGTGTLGILAGGWIEWPGEYGYPPFAGYLGAAPFQDIVPVRIGNSVVHFYTSAVAQGIMYALTGGDCQVVSLSMGGVASKSWAAAVNFVYEHGVAIFAASGDRYGISVPGSTVYPARFGRVVSVFGATADYTPYYKKCNLTRLQGSFGPEEKMSNTLVAYSPNIPWARYGCAAIIDLNGEGTSSSTPQAAGAAALWLQQHGQTYPADWRRVEAVRTALFQAADRDFKGYSFGVYGNGLLKAEDALAIIPPVESLQKKPEDQVFFPFLTLLFEYFEDLFPKKDMYRVEIAQLHHIDGLHKLIAHPEAQKGELSPALLRKYVSRLRKSAHISQELKGFLDGVYSRL